MLFALFFSTALATPWNKHSTLKPPHRNDWTDIPDRDAVDSRCSLTGLDLVESVQGDQWLPHFACPHGTTCLDLHGKGACKAGDQEYGVPGLNYLWLFACSDFYDPNTCHFPDPTISHRIRWNQEPYRTNNTRCSTNGRVVEHRVGQEWADLYACKPHATCVEAGDRAVCQQERDPAHLRRSGDLPAAQEITKPADIRCDPESVSHVQYFNKIIGWTTFHGCLYQCNYVNGRAACQDFNGFMFPTIPGLNGVEITTDKSKRSVPVHPNSHQDRITKCDSPTSSGISSFAEGHLIARSSCPRDMACRDVEGRAVCVEADRHYYMDHEEYLSRRDGTNDTKNPDLHVFDTRCNPTNLSEVQRFDHTLGEWVHHSQCTLKGICMEVQGYGACHLVN